MYGLTTFQNNEDYFTPLSTRKPPGVLFMRFIGYDSDLKVFYRRYQVATQKKGIYIDRPLPNPSQNEVAQIAETVDLAHFNAEQSYVKTAVGSWFTKRTAVQKALLADALFEVLYTLNKQGMSGGALKNAFVKFMCWGYYVFEGALRYIGQDDAPKILYEGDISKHEVYMLRVLSLAGCDVLYLNFTSDDSYLLADKTADYSRAVFGVQRGTPEYHYSKIDLKAWEKALQLKNFARTAQETIVTNAWFRGSFMEEIFKGNGTRGALNLSKIYNIFGCYLGFKELGAYTKYIYNWKKRLEETGKPIVLVEQKLANPTPDEVMDVKPFTYGRREALIAKLAFHLRQFSSPELNELIQGAFVRTLNQNPETKLSRLYNHGMRLLCWFNRYAEPLFGDWRREQIPVFLYYGSCVESEAEFMEMLAGMPVDVILLSPDKTAADAFQAIEGNGKRLHELLPNSSPVFPFPQEEPKVKLATTAYNAEKELDQLLYSGTGLYRNRQFTRSSPLTLKTTYDEIAILWQQEAKYRPHFEEGAGRVVVPNLFAKICGVPEGDAAQYFRGIEGMLTEQTIVIRDIPFIAKDTPNTMRAYTQRFLADGKIQADKLKKHEDYKLDYLHENTQDYILEKTQQLIDLKWIRAEQQGLEPVILSTVLNLDKETLRLIQQFDFTKTIPKVLAIDVDESMFSLEDCIYFLFLNLVGFDIAIFTPTGYRNIERYISPNAYEEYQIGQYLFHLRVPALRKGANRNTADPKRNRILKRLFGKG